MRGSVRATVLDRPAAAGLRKFFKVRSGLTPGERLQEPASAYT